MSSLDNWTNFVKNILKHCTLLKRMDFFLVWSNRKLSCQHLIREKFIIARCHSIYNRSFPHDCHFQLIGSGINSECSSRRNKLSNPNTLVTTGYYSAVWHRSFAGVLLVFMVMQWIQWLSPNATLPAKTGERGKYPGDTFFPPESMHATQGYFFRGYYWRRTRRRCWRAGGQHRHSNPSKHPPVRIRAPPSKCVTSVRQDSSLPGRLPRYRLLLVLQLTARGSQCVWI